MIGIRKPTDEITGCCWLPRFIDKVRMRDSGELSFLYRISFCSQLGLDGYFLRHFQLQQNKFLKTVQDSKGRDDLVSAWFLDQPTVTTERIAAWNALASRVGSKGYSGYWTFYLLKWVLYPKAIESPVSSLFEAIIQDEECDVVAK